MRVEPLAVTELGSGSFPPLTLLQQLTATILEASQPGGRKSSSCRFVERMNMNLSLLGVNHACEDILALRRVIAHLAAHCDLDLADPVAVRHFLDDDSSHDHARACEHHDCDELRATLTLLFRLEASSSEDLGIAGLHRLWMQHSEILARFNVRRPRQGGLETGSL